MTEKITVEQAYMCTFRFLELHHKETGSDLLLAILSGMQLLSDGDSADQAETEMWQEALDDVLAGKVDVQLRLTK